MKICKVNNYTAPARDSQGTQRVLEALGRQLTKEGHEVSLLINKGSATDFGKVVERIPDDVDVVHYHGGFPEEYGQDRRKGVWISTVHGGGQDSPSETAEKREWKNNLVFVSDFCAKRCESQTYIHNCVQEEDFPYREKKDDYFLWMAGTDWGEEKGLFSSLMFAKKMGFKLKIAGGGKNRAIIDEIKKNCDSKIQYLGFVNGKEKAELLAGAKGLLMIGSILDACPVNVLEAFACGTPVVAKNKGSHPEIVKKDVGFVCDTAPQITKAIFEIEKIKPEACRNYYLQNFTPEIAVKKYLSVYKNMLEYGKVNP